MSMGKPAYVLRPNFRRASSIPGSSANPPFVCRPASGGLTVFRSVVTGDHDLSAEVESAEGTADSPATGDRLATAAE